MEIYNDVFDPLFSGLLVAGVPLLAVCFGLVQWLKTAFNLQDRPVLFVSMGVGLLLGVGFKLSVLIPTSFAEWFGVVLFGLSLGLVASGIYKGIKQAASGVG